jgi:LPXTG-motif cell wall-anchored protein
VTFDPAVAGASQASATVTVAGCTGPEPPPDIAFAFATIASVESAAVGDTVEYAYCAENTSGVPLEVVQVVDDRLGMLELPPEPTVVAPGETLCSDDLGPPISYVVAADDAGTTSTNNAVVTVRTVEQVPRTFQVTASAKVEIQALRIPPTRLAETGSDQTGIQVVLAGMLSCLGLVLVVGTRRRAR